MGAPEKGETKLIRMRVPANLYRYLGVLSRRTVLGASENDVAQYLLTQRLETMISEQYQRSNTVPKPFK